jgi:hypothetical protein
MTDNEHAQAAQAERRNGQERRKLTLKTFMVGAVRGRRRGDRRATDLYHVDWHEPDLLFLAVTTLMLSVIDAFFTLTLLRHGAMEANPLLNFVLAEHPAMFAAIKMLLTGLGVLVLVAAARLQLFRVLRVKTVLQCLLLGYIALFGYEMWLLRGIF